MFSPLFGKWTIHSPFEKKREKQGAQRNVGKDY